MATKAAKKKYHHWDYYVSLTNDLETISHYVEIHPDNFKTYSTAFTRLYLSAGSEVDVVAKMLCKKYNPSSKADNITGYRKELRKQEPKISSIIINMKRCGLEFVPWQAWSQGNTNPQWWKNYNNVKHNRDMKYREANLEMCLQSLAGLCVLLAYLYPDRMSEPMGVRRPALFLADEYRKDGVALYSAAYELPH
ncbi:MAG: hypothetical protein OEV87_05375 [Phycisphaerae bacterium]|nr:hypothetical protein [Phycisphaerae bacterium]